MKNNRFFYNLKGIFRSLTPQILTLNHYKAIIKDWQLRKDADYIKERVDYYCPLDTIKPLGSDAERIATTRFCKKKTLYYFDVYEYLRYFPQDLRAYFAFGDVNYSLPTPSITKSRPIGENIIMGGGISDKSLLDCKNSVLLNLEKIRHFIFTYDPISFENKQDKLFYRGAIYQPHRISFFEKYFDNPLCDLGHTGSKDIHHAWQKPKIDIKAHFPYKFLLSLEGNDVASNLKWVMNSNSVAVMPRPKFETWFMEGRLKPDYHYIEIASDYSNLEEKLAFYRTHEDKTKAIINHAHDFVAQFKDKRREDIIACLVLLKYFNYTAQEVR